MPRPPTGWRPVNPGTDLGENRLNAPVAMVRIAAMIFKIASISASLMKVE
jgi:hypothetical protein